MSAGDKVVPLHRSALQEAERYYAAVIAGETPPPPSSRSGMRACKSMLDELARDLSAQHRGQSFINPSMESLRAEADALRAKYADLLGDEA